MDRSLSVSSAGWLLRWRYLKPEILFLDEPTAVLDVASRVELHAIMHELKADGTTIILATHDIAEAEKMADRVAILLKGKLAAIGTPQQLTAQGNRHASQSILN